jgi:hypothetical protein
MSNYIGQVTEPLGEERAPQNVLGRDAAKPFYIWANDDCDNKTDSFKEAKVIRLELFNDGCEDVHIVDADGIEVVDAEIEAHEALVKHGYFAGARNPAVKPDFPGLFMVNDPRDAEGFAIVGDDIASLILEARKHLIAPASELEVHGNVQEAAEESAVILVSLDGGKTFVPASSGVRIIYKDVLVPGEDAPGELHLNATTEGLISDLWVSREEHLDHNLGTSSQMVDDLVERLVDDPVSERRDSYSPGM